MVAVLIRNLNKTFRSRTTVVHALRDVNIEIKKGEIFGLLGPNGAGKTTLISVITGTTTPDTGSVTIFEHDIVNDRFAAQNMMNMVRGFGGVLRGFSVLEMLKYYALLYDVKWTRQELEALLKRIGLFEKRDEVVSDFSSGWRQRFFIAKALINKPKLLLLDEPTVGLDVDVAVQMRTLIKELKAEGYTILLTTHYMQEAEELCDQIALITQGSIVAQGTAKELKSLLKREEAIEIKGVLHDGVYAKLQNIKGVLGCAKHGDGIHLLVKDRTVITDVMRVLAASHCTVDVVRRKETTLEDTFLKLTSKGLSDA